MAVKTHIASLISYIHMRVFPVSTMIEKLNTINVITELHIVAVSTIHNI
jgi:hypothetical protein